VFILDENNNDTLVREKNVAWLSCCDDLYDDVACVLCRKMSDVAANTACYFVLQVTILALFKAHGSGCLTTRERESERE
jgi:hypothetical protein